jgi:hypothetical protein
MKKEKKKEKKAKKKSKKTFEQKTVSPNLLDLKMLDPVFEKNFEVIFPICNDILSNMVKSIDRRSICFNLNLISTDGSSCKMLPLKELMILAEEKRTLNVLMFRQDGSVFMKSRYHDCKFVFSVHELLFHDYESNNIKSISVEFAYSHIEVFDETGEVIERIPGRY